MTTTIGNLYLELKETKEMVNIHSIRKFECGCIDTADEYLRYINDWQDEYISFDDYILDFYHNIPQSFYTRVHVYGNILVLVRECDGKCPYCRDDKKYCDEQIRPTGFESVDLYHGINAYYCSGETEEIISNFNGIYNHPEWQICCSTSTVGDIGLIIEGTVLMASRLDLNTEISRDGRRYFEERPYRSYKLEDYIVRDAEELWESNEFNMNDEIITTNNKITGLWITDNASDEALEALKIILKEHPEYSVVTLKQEF